MHSTDRGGKNAYIVVGNPERKRKLARPRHGLKDDMKANYVRGVVRLWIEFSWLRRGASDGPL